MTVTLKNWFYFFIFFFFKYSTPSNINYLWNFGVLALVFFLLQIMTGLFLSIFYIPNIEYAFLSVENIMRNINNGWLIRYMHANGASFFFIVVYLHIFRNLYYKTYLPPKTFVWITGVIIFFLMIVTAFTGYVLPWGQMSFWAATVITNLFSSIPIFGSDIVILLWGDYTVSNITLNRFFSLHFILPFILMLVIAIHLLLLHEKGSNNPLLIYSKNDKILFHPYFTVKDFYIIFIWFFMFFFIIGFYPDLLGHPDNYVEANPLVTPPHIVPEWYFLLFYAILRSVPSKLGGVATLAYSIFILIIFPFFFRKFQLVYNKEDTSYIKKQEIDFLRRGENFAIYFVFGALLRKITRITTILDKLNFINNYIQNYYFFNFFFICVGLSILGSYPAEGQYLILSKLLMLHYFFYFSLYVKLEYENESVFLYSYKCFLLFCNKYIYKKILFSFATNEILLFFWIIFFSCVILINWYF